MRRLLLCGVLLLFAAAPAAAQPPGPKVNVSAFGGLAWVPGPHASFGMAVGVRPRQGPVSVEIEYARSRSDPPSGVPAVVIFSTNVLFQVAVEPARLEVYGTVGLGIYGVQLEGNSSEPNDARNFGGGVKLTLAGPLKFRVDYRAFRLAPIGGEYHSHEHRIYAGLVAGF